MELLELGQCVCRIQTTVNSQSPMLFSRVNHNGLLVRAKSERQRFLTSLTVRMLHRSAGARQLVAH